MYVLPGTNIEIKEMSFEEAKELFESVFLTGGLVMSQVSGMTDCPPHVIQNWVKREFLPPPKNKKYSKGQFCRIAFINFLKEVMQIDTATALMGYINGVLDDESDDLVDDCTLYCYFVHAIGKLNRYGYENIDKAVEEAAEGFADENARGRLLETLKIMVTAYGAYRLKSEAVMMIGGLNL